MAAPMAVTAVQATTSQFTALAADGTDVRLRPLRRDERDLVATFFAGLSAESRRRRFLQALPRLPRRLLRHLVDVNGRRHVAMVAEAGDQTAGIARFVALPGEPGTAEVAVTVADRFQGRGIGGLLLDALRPAGEQAGIGAFVCLVDPTNRPMLRLLRRRGVALRLRDGLVEGRQQLHLEQSNRACPRRAGCRNSATVTSTAVPKWVSVAGAGPRRAGLGPGPHSSP
jgi:ribosomal protein S18 acetylase RimI-like enzyme